MSVLVTGGAGYIGSHVVHRLREAGRSPVVIDSLVTGHRDAVPEGVPFLVADIAERERVGAFVRTHEVDAVMHFAALSQVGESVREPRRYFRANLGATHDLLETVLDHGIRCLVFSSTAAVYGTPRVTPIPEGHPTDPVNPYGVTKLGIERMLLAYDDAYGLRHVALRYFNAAGALAEAGLGERHDPESHLIPLILAKALGAARDLVVHGDDYDTPDGTCVRDYIHVVDLADAHVTALEHLERGGRSETFNLGTGRGHSVREVLDAARRVTGHDIPASVGPRRPGDPPVLVANPSRAESTLGFAARRSSLEEMIGDAWRFHSASAARGAGSR
ncbi:MAG TPA: UDP-glucose 4-epimerase GalE [Byssovorax sp.]|jgi:UDP-glucose-4-epimerase GalE